MKILYNTTKKISRYGVLLSLLLGTFSATGNDDTQIKSLDISDKTFTCMRDMVKVEGFYVENLHGNTEATVNVAKSETGGVYPPGSVIQLVPTEVMVKRSKGFSPVSNDWEFFELDVSPKGSKILKRGFADVVNRFGGNCLGCHVKAEPQWDMVCKTGRGCDPIPLTKEVLAVIQKTDPRCKDNEQLNEKEIQIMAHLKKVMAAITAK